MINENALAQAGFDKVGEGAGVVQAEMFGEKMEMPYSATYFINRAGTVALAIAADPTQGEIKHLFLSRTSQPVMTMGGQSDGSLEVDGTLINALAVDNFEAMLASHLQIIGDAAVSDRDTLLAEIQVAPQRAADLTMLLMAKMMEAFQS